MNDELYIGDFYRMLNDVYNHFTSATWKVVPTTQEGVLQLAVLSIGYNETKVTKAALEVIEKGHLHFIVFGDLFDISMKEPSEKTERSYYTIPFYDVEQAFAEFRKIVNLN